MLDARLEGAHGRLTAFDRLYALAFSLPVLFQWDLRDWWAF